MFMFLVRVLTAIAGLLLVIAGVAGIYEAWQQQSLVILFIAMVFIAAGVGVFIGGIMGSVEALDDIAFNDRMRNMTQIHYVQPSVPKILPPRPFITTPSAFDMGSVKWEAQKDSLSGRVIWIPGDK